MASSAVNSTKDAKLAFCRLVEETSGRETLRYFGPGCLVKFESTQFLHSVGTPTSNYFLVASNQVLPKVLLGALEKQEKERRKKREPTVKMVAEFQELKSEGKLERKPLSELYRSLDEDVFELEGITYVALTKLEQGLFRKSSLLNRALEVANTTKGNSPTVLTSDQLQCFVFCSERTINREDRNVGELSTIVYDLLHVDSVLANDESRFPSYFLRNEEKKRFLGENEFQNSDGKPLGSIILGKDCKFGGVLNFINNNPAPALVGSGFDTGICSDTHSSQGDVAPKAGEKHDVTEREIPAGASGGIYPLLGPQFKSEVSTEATNKTDVSTLSQPAVTPSTGNQFVAGLTDESKSEESSGDPGAINPQELPAVDGEKEVEEKEDQDFASGGPSPTENSYTSQRFSSSNKTEQEFKGTAYVVNLLPKNDVVKSEPPREVPADPLPINREPPGEIPANPFLSESSETQDRSRDSARGQERRCSFPPDPTKKQEHPPPSTLPVQRSSSVPPSGHGGIRKFRLSDPLNKTMLGSLELLEETSRCLDQEYKYGQCKCWKHVAQFFGVPEEEYENFKCSQVHSPTEVMFEYLESVRPEITVGVLKDGLAQIDRQDVTDILLKHEKCDPPALNDETLVCSLFDSDPDIIGEMAVFLDKQKPGLKKWSHLAAKLEITRKIFKTFETSSTDNPTEKFFDIVKVKFPKLTVGELIGHLEAIQRRDVINAIKESVKVTECSVIKDLIAHLDVMDNVCELFNTRKRATKVLGLKHLGKRLGITKEILDDLLPTQEETQSPTEALIRHLGGKNPSLTLADFIWALHFIDRPDVITVLDGYLPDGCIPNLLKMCACERCKESSLKQSGEGH
ncbi:uncharacterized protein LOC144665279 isoform X2 [Oculina patagonica]